MTPREATLAAINHQEVRPVPYVLGFEGDVNERLDRHYGGPQWRQRLKPYFHWVGAVDTMRKFPIEGQEGMMTDVFGATWNFRARPFHLDKPAMPEPSFKNYRWPEAREFFVDEPALAAARKSCRDNHDKFRLASLPWGLFESSWGIRGFENVLMDAVAEPEFFEELLDRITALFLEWVDYTFTNLPETEAVFFGDDWADQRGIIIGPERWRKLFKPRLAKIYARVHGYGKYVITHCCGSPADVLDDAVEIGLNVLESCQPEAKGMNPYELKKRFGKRLAFWGCLGVQGIVPFGTPAQVTDVIKRLIAEMGKGGGFILAPAKDLQPETPTANAVAVVEAFTSQIA